MMIVPDSREPKSLIGPALTDKCSAFKIDVAPPIAHDCGDFWLMPQGGTFTIVERKTPSDFEGSIRDQRLFRQIDRCLATAAPVEGRVVLLLEAITEMYPTYRHGVNASFAVRRGMHPNSVRGVWLWLQERQVRIIPTKDGDDTINTLIWLYEKARIEGKSHDRKLVSRRQTPGDSQDYPLGQDQAG